MTGKRQPGPGFSLSRWSRRKLEAAREAAATASAPAVPNAPLPAAASVPAAAPVELPPVASLTFDSDFSAFLRPGVDDTLKRAALKQLFRDPRFNVMDGLDTYIDDYTKADPVPSDVLADLMQRFGAEAEPAPAVAAGGGEPAGLPSQPSLSPASGGERAQERRGSDAEEGLPPAPEALVAVPRDPSLSTLSAEEGGRPERSAAEGAIASPSRDESR